MELTFDDVTVDMTPGQLARAFWQMSDREQLEFFSELGREIDAHEARAKAELQWHALGKCLLQYEGPQPDEGCAYVNLRRNRARRARETLMAMAAPLYLHTLRECDRLSGVL